MHAYMLHCHQLIKEETCRSLPRAQHQQLRSSRERNALAYIISLAAAAHAVAQAAHAAAHAVAHAAHAAHAAAHVAVSGRA